jgi:hypothetical protein
VTLRVNAGNSIGQSVNPEVLNDRLPDQTRNQLSPIDFSDFLEKLIAAGEADDADDRDLRLRKWDYLAGGFGALVPAPRQARPRTPAEVLGWQRR